MIYIEVLLRVYVKVGLEPIISRKKSARSWDVGSEDSIRNPITLPFLLIISNFHLFRPNYILVELQVPLLNISLPLGNPLDG